MFAEDEARLLRRWAADETELRAWTRRRTAGEPVEQIVGRVEFDGLVLRVGPGVFVPRQRTALLARTVEALVAARGAPPFVEACCGAAPLGAVLRRRWPALPVLLADIDATALRYAAVNVPDATLCRGDLLSGVPGDLRGHVGVIAAVPPYVPDSQAGLLPREALRHEPAAALFGGADGLRVVDELLAQACTVLGAGGALALELNVGQAEVAAETAGRRGYRVGVVDAGDGQTAVLVAERPPVAARR